MFAFDLTWDIIIIKHPSVIWFLFSQFSSILWCYETVVAVWYENRSPPPFPTSPPKILSIFSASYALCLFFIAHSCSVLVSRSWNLSKAGLVLYCKKLVVATICDIVSFSKLWCGNYINYFSAVALLDLNPRVQNSAFVTEDHRE